jgi:hypothetical protein
MIENTKHRLVATSDAILTNDAEYDIDSASQEKRNNQFVKRNKGEQIKLNDLPVCEESST